MLGELGPEDEVETKIDEDTPIYRKGRKVVRAGWAEASAAIAEGEDDALVMGEFGNADDEKFSW